MKQLAAKAGLPLVPAPTKPIQEQCPENRCALPVTVPGLTAECSQRDVSNELATATEDGCVVRYGDVAVQCGTTKSTSSSEDGEDTSCHAGVDPEENGLLWQRIAGCGISQRHFEHTNTFSCGAPAIEYYEADTPSQYDDYSTTTVRVAGIGVTCTGLGIDPPAVTGCAP